MLIVLVVDSFADKSNGTSMTAARFATALQHAGHSVRVVAPHVEGEGFYPLRTRYIPIVSEFSRPQHMVFGKPDKAVLERAFAGADVVHLFLPFKLEQVAIKVAQSMRIPYMAAFHLQPEHITYNIGLQNLAPLNFLAISPPVLSAYPPYPLPLQTYQRRARARRLWREKICHLQWL